MLARKVGVICVVRIDENKVIDSVVDGNENRIRSLQSIYSDDSLKII